MDTVEQILARISGDKEGAYLMGIMYSHRPLIKHGGDQRDPTEEITCSCMKSKDSYVAHSLDQPYFIHLYEIVSGLLISARADTGR